MRTHRYIEFCSAALLAAFIATTSPARRWDLNINGKNQRLSEENGSNITSSTSENVTSVSTQRNRSQSSFAFYREGTELSDLVEPKSHRVKVNVSDMIDFAIVGNPKTGTTFMMDWMHRHPEILIPDVEMRAMLFEAKGPGLSVEKLFPLYEQKTFPKKLGFKCPAVVRELPALRNMRDYFPNTKFIVGIRHPVWWFQSFYNYRVRLGYDLPSPLQSRGPCRKENAKACTYNAYFHLFLAQMGRPTISSHEEKILLRYHDIDTLESLPFNLTVVDPPMPNPIFLYEQNQMDGRNFPKIADRFRLDLSDYLQLKTPLLSLEEASRNTYVYESSENNTDPSVVQVNDSLKENILDICEARFQALRDELIVIGQDVAKWIDKYYLSQAHVTSSSPAFIRQMLKRYKDDPCEKVKA